MKKIIFILLLLIIIFLVSKENQQELYIPESSIRLRVIPNSNKEYDIYIKEQIKKYLEKDLYQQLKTTSNIEEARTIIKDSIPNIDNNILNIFKNNNYKEPYIINYGYNYFPEKNYLNKTYQEGYYESLVITIGKGEGNNWWCALFPNFCLLDTEEDPEYESFIYNIIKELF